MSLIFVCEPRIIDRRIDRGLGRGENLRLRRVRISILVRRWLVAARKGVADECEQGRADDRTFDYCCRRSFQRALIQFHRSIARRFDRLNVSFGNRLISKTNMAFYASE